ncbi:MAG: anti-sigma factor family protein [Myxococcota bacterium]
MSEKHCPIEAELVSFVDADLSPEQLERIERHLGICSACRDAAAGLKQLISDVAAPLPQPTFDVAQHVASVMQRLDSPPRVESRATWLAWAGSLAAAAAVVLLLFARGPSTETPRGHFEARGSASASPLSRDVGIELYTQQQKLIPLVEKASVQQNTAFTAGLRNVGTRPAYLLLFAVDARSEVHWIAPEFTDPNSDPEATRITPSASEQLLSRAVVFDDLAPGPLRVMVLLSASALRVSGIESLPARERELEALKRRFPKAEVREFLLNVAPNPTP